MSNIVSQGLQESILEARRAYPELSVLTELLEVRASDGPAALQPALLTSTAGAGPVGAAAAAPAPLPAVQTLLEDAERDPALLNTILQLIKSQTEQAQALQTAPPSLAAAGHHAQLLQQFFGSAPIPSSWNAVHTGSGHLHTSISAPATEGAGGISAIAATANANYQVQHDAYTNLIKRQRLNNPNSNNNNMMMATPSAGVVNVAAGGYNTVEKRCSNCGASNTPFWRKDRFSKLSLCNACGLYAAKNDHPRPFRLWKEGQNVDHLIAAEAAAAQEAAQQHHQQHQQQQRYQQQQQQQQQEDGQNTAVVGDRVQYSAADLDVLRSTVIADVNDDGIGGGHDDEGEAAAAIIETTAVDGEAHLDD
jgi:GATA zinc finger